MGNVDQTFQKIIDFNYHENDIEYFKAIYEGTGVKYTIDEVAGYEEIRGLIPVHPRCRCTWLPVVGNPIIEQQIKPEDMFVDKLNFSNNIGVNDYWNKTFEKDFSKYDRKLGKNETIQKMKEGINKDLKNAKLCITIDDKNLANVINDGRFKTQFETKASKAGFLDTKYRKEVEKNYYGYGNIKPENRPIYGFLQDKNSNNFGSTSSYGNIQIELDKNKYIGKTTFMYGDTLDTYGYGKGSIGTFKNFNETTISTIKIEEAINLVEQNKFNLIGINESNSFGYIEAQYHGQVLAKDIRVATIRIDVWDVNNASLLPQNLDRTTSYLSNNKEIMSLLKDNNIKVNFVDRNFEDISGFVSKVGK